MTYHKYKILQLCLLVGGLLGGINSSYAVKRYKPFVLASETRGGDVVQKARIIKESLRDQDFKIVGEYQPFKDAYVIAVTSKELRKAVRQKSGCGPYAIVQRVALTKVKNVIQVSYTNPIYMAYAYRMKNNLEKVEKRLSVALGHVREFGSKRGKTKRKLKKYHYTFGMEYCTNVHKIATYDSYSKAIKEVEKGLAAHKGGVSKVYRVDLPNDNGTLFGVSMTEDYSSDKLIFSKIDYKNKYKHTAHLPYDLYVKNDGKIVALHTRFRVALSWPDLKMAGDPSFLKIIKAPDDIEKALSAVSGKPKQIDSFEGDDEFDFDF